MKIFNNKYISILREFFLTNIFNKFARKFCYYTRIFNNKYIYIYIYIYERISYTFHKFNFTFYNIIDPVIVILILKNS